MLERHTGKGLRVAQGLSPGWQPSFTPSSAQKERCFAVYQDSFYPVPAATGLPWITGVHKVTSSPFLHTTMLMFLGIFWQRPYWAGSTTAPFSKKRIFLKGIGRETSLGIASFPQPVTLAVMHTLIWEEV